MNFGPYIDFIVGEGYSSIMYGGQHGGRQTPDTQTVTKMSVCHSGYPDKFRSPRLQPMETMYLFRTLIISLLDGWMD